jgi:APA family basic amino acid/polyamine antiporter
MAILISTLGANNANILTSARVTYAMAREKRFVRAAAAIHSKFKTPANALILQGAWAAILTFTGSYDQLITYMIFASWIFYGMSAGAVIILRKKRPDLARPYRVWGYPWVPVIFIIFALWLTANTILEAPRDAAIGAGLILLGLPAYFYWNAKR